LTGIKNKYKDWTETWKMPTIRGQRHSRADTDRLYVPREREKRTDTDRKSLPDRSYEIDGMYRVKKTN
jgi:hypothetical protein